MSPKFCKQARPAYKVALGGLVALGLHGATATATTYITCGGEKVKWHKTPDIVRLRCSIPDSGDIRKAYNNAVNVWNDRLDQFGQFLVTDSCAAVDHGDSVNSMFISSDLGANIAGLTFSRFSCPFNGTPRILEADIGILASLPFSKPEPDNWGNSGWGTFVHEFGHFWGLDDDNGTLSIMHQQQKPYTGGPERATVWPDDVAGVAYLYGLSAGASAVPNLGVTAFKLDAANTVVRMESTNRHVCKNSWQSLTFRFVNSGGADVGTFKYRIRVTTDPNGTGGITYENISQPGLPSLGARNFTTSMLIPSWLSDGTYFAFVEIDPDGLINEFSRWDNWTKYSVALLVDC